MRSNCNNINILIIYLDIYRLNALFLIYNIMIGKFRKNGLLFLGVGLQYIANT